MRRLAWFVVALATTACSGRISESAWRAERTASIESNRRLGAVPDRFRWEQRAVLPLPFRAACDLVSTPAGIVVAAAVAPLEANGAALFRMAEDGALEPLLTWGGQGFLRVRSLKNRTFVPDADAPFSAISFAWARDVDGYVFVSDASGMFAEERRELLPSVYHVHDVVELADGTVVGSAGAYPIGDVAYFSASAPGAILVDDGADRPWRRALEYPERASPGVTRLTQLHAVPDGALLAAVESSRPDLPPAIRITGLPGDPVAQPVTTLKGPPVRWAQLRDGRIAAVTAWGFLQVSSDGGRSFVDLGALRGVQNAIVADDEVLVLAEGALWLAREGARHFEQVADAEPALATPAGTLVTPALLLHQGRVFAASLETGEIWEAVRSRE